MIGRKFGDLEVVEYAGRSNGVSLWRCECKCGLTKTLRAHQLRRFSKCNHVTINYDVIDSEGVGDDRFGV